MPKRVARVPISHAHLEIVHLEMVCKPIRVLLLTKRALELMQLEFLILFRYNGVDFRKVEIVFNNFIYF